MATEGVAEEFDEPAQDQDDRGFREKVEAGDPVYGVSAAMAGMDPITVTSFLPADWIWVDTEHASYDLREVREMVSVVPEGTATLTRVPGAHPKEVERVLDAGSDGIIVPKLRTIEEVQAFVDSAYYPPEGDRGVAGSSASTFGMEFGTEFMQRSNEEVFVVIQVEIREIVDNLDGVAGIEGDRQPAHRPGRPVVSARRPAEHGHRGVPERGRSDPAGVSGQRRRAGLSGRRERRPAVRRGGLASALARFGRGPAGRGVRERLDEAP